MKLVVCSIHILYQLAWSKGRIIHRHGNEKYSYVTHTSAAAIINVCPVRYDSNHRALIVTIKMNHIKVIKSNRI